MSRFKIKKTASKLAFYCFVLFVSLCLFEFVYRIHLIDFYKNSFTALNEPEILKQKKADFLIFGDSFSAFPNGYVEQLKSQNLEKSILNFSVSGIGIKQTNLFVKQKIKKYNPDVVIYQVYVGNDLIDVQNVTNWEALSFQRNIYWEVSDVFLSLRYLNQNFAFLKQQKNLKSDFTSSFDENKYNFREKLLVKANPYYIEKSVLITEDFELRYQVWKEELESFLKSISDNRKVYIVFIPHKVQLNSFYFDTMEKIGAKFSNRQQIFANDYPFLEKAKTDFKNHKNVMFLNPLSYFREIDKAENRLYFENDEHLNEIGQQVLSNYLSEEILK